MHVGWVCCQIIVIHCIIYLVQYGGGGIRSLWDSFVALTAKLDELILKLRNIGGRTRVNFGTLWIPFRYPRACGEKVVYLSFAGISCSFGSSRHFVYKGRHQIQYYRSERNTNQRCTLDAAGADGLDDGVDFLETGALIRFPCS